jgi:ribosome recycling factor
MSADLLREVEMHMKHALDHFTSEMKHLRTGRASTALLDGITIDYYGAPAPLNQVANLSVADASLIIANPYDPSQMSAIERAIRNSDRGLNPSNDGKVIRIPVPSLTEERRKAIVKQAHDMSEHCRNAIRQARREGNDKLKKMEKDHAISQDDERRLLDEVQKLHDKYIGSTNTLLEQKEKDIMTV